MPTFKYDPIKPLLESRNTAIAYFTQRDLLDRNAGPIEKLWDLPEVRSLLKKQQPDGSWSGSKKHPQSKSKYPLTETWRRYRYLVQQYEMDKSHPSIEKASEYILSCQTDEGDIRGILCNQYAPYYTGAILYLLIKAGYENDARIDKGIKWLLDMRQNDGGWLIGSPGMVNRSWKEITKLTSTWTSEPERDFDRSKPFSAAGTGMAIRALSIHPAYQKSESAIKAATLLKSKFLKKDNWSWLGHPDNWVRFQFPFWWTSLISALDSVSHIGLPNPAKLSKEDDAIKKALQWFIEHQEKTGLWKVSYSRIHKVKQDDRTYEKQLWITLSICRILKRHFG